MKKFLQSKGSPAERNKKALTNQISSLTQLFILEEHC